MARTDSSSKIKGIIIEIGGDCAPLQQALKEVDTAINKTKSNLIDVSKLLKLDPENITLLEQKWDYLNNIISQTQNKLKSLQDIKTIADEKQIDKSSDAYQDLVREIEKTKIELKGYEKQQKDTIEIVKKSGKSVEELTEKNKDFAKQLEKVSKEAEKTGKGINASLVNFNSFLQIAGKVGNALKQIVNSFISIETNAASTAKELQKLAKQTDLSTEQLQQLSYVAEICGIDLTTITKTVKQNLLAMKESEKFNWQYMDAYNKLGIQLKDTNGELRDSGEVYWDVISALRAMEEGTTREIIAETLLGRKASDLNALLSLTQEEYEALIKQADELGIIWSETDISTLSKVQESITNLKLTYEAFKREIAVYLAPIFKQATEWITNFLAKINEILEAGGTFKDVIKLAWEEIKPLLVQAFNWIKKEIKALAIEIWQTIKGVGDPIDKGNFWEKTRYFFQNMFGKSTLLPAATTGKVLTAQGISQTEQLQQLSSSTKLAYAVQQPTQASQEQVININFTGSLSQLARILEPEITAETNRLGSSLLK